jgi:cobalt-zinc-cadmium efflux system membrane fusion protein
MAEVLSGLKEGERYAAKGSFLLKSELQKGELGEHGH